MIAKPVIYISLQEICDTHRLLLQHKDIIINHTPTNDVRDLTPRMTPEGRKLNELLKDLGGEPSLCSLVGAASHMFAEGSNEENQTLANLAKVKIKL